MPLALLASSIADPNALLLLAARWAGLTGRAEVIQDRIGPNAGVDRLDRRRHIVCLLSATVEVAISGKTMLE